MDIDWSQVIAAVIGGVLASGTGWLFERKREAARIAQARAMLKVAICDDLEHSITLYDKVAEEWEKTKTVWFATLNELRESRGTYQNNKDWITIFEDAALRRKIFRYYLQSTDRVNTLEYQQRRKYEIDARLNDIVRDLKFKNPEFSHEQAVKVAVTYMEPESREYDNLLRSVPEAVSALKDFKSQAQGLLAQLKEQKT